MGHSGMSLWDMNTEMQRRGRLGAGRSKSFSPEEIARRKEILAAARTKRWAGWVPKPKAPRVRKPKPKPEPPAVTELTPTTIVVPVPEAEVPKRVSIL